MKKLLFLLMFISSTTLLGNSISLEIENDLLFDTDQRYTHGTRITYEYNDLYWSLGQNLYTPSDITIDKPITNDRPYAGSLYVSLNGTKYWENRDIYHKLELAVGTVGEYSYAGTTQTAIHKWSGSTTPMGWDYQTDDMILLQAGIDLFGEIFTTKYINARAYVSGDVGTIKSHIGFGANIMAGYNIPQSLNKPIASKKGDFSLFVFTDALERHVFYNKLLESDYTHIKQENAVLDIRTGVGVIYKNTEIRYAYCFRSKEFWEQVSPSEFGSIFIKISY